MNILVACEESGRVTHQFLLKGHNAYSCDIMETSGFHPDRHIVGDVSNILKTNNIRFMTQNGLPHFVEKWDMIIAFPPCTYMTNASAVRMRVKGEIQPEISKGYGS